MRRLNHRNPLLPGLIGALALWGAAAGARAETYNVGVATELNFGRIVSAASSATDYTVSAQTNALTPAQTYSNSGVTRGKINLTCGSGSCGRKTVKVLLFSPANSQNGRLGRLKAFNAISADTTSITTKANADGSLLITIGSFPTSGGVSLYFGGTATVDSNASANSTGNYTTPYTVQVTSSTNAVNTYSSNAKAQVMRGLSVSKTGDLLFGTIVRPASGTGHVSMPIFSIFPDATGGAEWVSTSTTSRPRFTVTAETGTAFSIQIATPRTAAVAGKPAIPAPNGYFNLVGPGGKTIEVVTTSDALASKTIGSVVGQAGTYSFNVGGEFDLPASTPSGTYSAVFNVVVNYQ